MAEQRKPPSIPTDMKAFNRPDERDELATSVPYLEIQQKLTSRKIPLMILERVSS